MEMRVYIYILWNLLFVLMVYQCLARKHQDKKRDKSRDSRVSKKYKKADASKKINDVLHEICLPSKSDRLVYRYKNESHIFIGFDDIQNSTVYSMLWEIGKGNSEVLSSDNHNGFKKIPALDVRKYVTKEDLLAAADQKLQDLFLDNLVMCGQSRITPLACVIQSFAVLARKMGEVTFGKPCGN